MSVLQSVEIVRSYTNQREFHLFVYLPLNSALLLHTLCHEELVSKQFTQCFWRAFYIRLWALSEYLPRLPLVHLQYLHQQRHLTFRYWTWELWSLESSWTQKARYFCNALCRIRRLAMSYPHIKRKTSTRLLSCAIEIPPTITTTLTIEIPPTVGGNLFALIHHCFKSQTAKSPSLS